MKLKSILLILILAIIISPVLAASQTVSYTQSGTWACPDGVTSINLKMIGGGSGGLGGYWWANYTGSYRTGHGPGAGGLAGEYISVSNIPVTPRQSYNIVVGPGGQGQGGAGNVIISEINIWGGNNGSTSSAFGYTVEGGFAPRMWFPFNGAGYTVDYVLGNSSGGDTGYGNYQVTTQGSTGYYPGTNGGIGYGAGGGGGGGGDYVGGGISFTPDVYPGAGSNGAYGYVEITYDASNTQLAFSGKIIDATTGNGISGASIGISQLSYVWNATSTTNGAFSFPDTTGLIYGVPITVITTYPNYAPDYNVFTPLSTTPVVLTVPLIPLSSYVSNTIVGITRESLYGNPVSATVSGIDIITNCHTSGEFTYASTGFYSLSAIYDPRTGCCTGIPCPLDSSHYYSVTATSGNMQSPAAVLVQPFL
jgi:hypothetical protein